MDKKFEDYLKEVKNVSGSRKHKITGSQNTISGFNYYRKIRPKEKEFTLKDKEYLSIIREMNKLVADYLIENKFIRLPSGFGYFEILKKETSSWINEDGKFASNKVVDMNSTIKLWYEDEECRVNKTLVRYDNEFLFRIKYPLNGRMYKDNFYFSMKFNRVLRQRLSSIINSGSYDACTQKHTEWVKQNEQI